MKNQITPRKKMMITVCLLTFVTFCFFQAQAQDRVGISTTTPAGKLHIEGTSDVSQLVIDANATQGNNNPTIRIRNSSNADVMWIHSDNPENCFLGMQTGRVNTGSRNTFTGSHVGYSNTTGSYNTVTGANALYKTETASFNTAMGTNALYYNVSGHANVAIGYLSLQQNLAAGNTAVGTNSLQQNTMGTSNVAMGYNSLVNNKAGNNSVAIGANCMENANNSEVEFDADNVAVGHHALRGSSTPSSNTGNKNVAIGSWALTANTSGNHNIAQGFHALIANTTGSFNTANGALALEDNTTGFSNAADGHQALSKNTIGFGNTAIGALSLFNNITGNNNTGIGRSAYFINNNLSNTTAIGYGSGGVVEASNRIEIGNTSVSWVGGQMNWGTYSDGRIKDNVREDVPGLEFINRLRPVTYNLNIHRANEMVNQDKGENEEWDGKYDIEQIRISGFIAQEVEAAAADIDYDFSGVQKPPKEDELYSLRYAEFVMPLVKSVQQLSQENEALKDQLAEQEALLQVLANKMDLIEKSMK